jgi:protein-S-isoprenylcysteine O-methyltransferase Ste14
MLIAPYAFMALTVWTPFTRMKALLAVGAACYLLSIGTFFAMVRVFARASSHQPVVEGPYRFSRNPM